MRKKVFIAGGLLALIILLGSSTAFAQSPSKTSSRTTNPRIHSEVWISKVATELHLTSEDVAAMQAEIAAGKSIKDVFAEHNITMAQIRNALGTVSGSEHVRLSNTQISNIAGKLGLDPVKVQADIASGETLPQILKKYNIGKAQLEEVFGQVSGKKSAAA